MAKLKPALPTIWLHEGGFSNDKTDPGGATNYGISLRFLKQIGDLNNDGWADGDIDRDGDVDIDDIRKMTKEIAEIYYDNNFWKPNQYARIDDQEIATKVFDLAVNMGSTQANKCLQRAVRAASVYYLLDDGRIGAKTLHAVNLTNRLALMAALKSEAASVYRLIIAKNPKMGKYRSGWESRAYGDIVK